MHIIILFIQWFFDIHARVNTSTLRDSKFNILLEDFIVLINIQLLLGIPRKLKKTLILTLNALTLYDRFSPALK